MGDETLRRLLSERDASAVMAKKIRTTQNVRKAVIRYGIAGVVHTVLAVGVFTAVYEYSFRQHFDVLTSSPVPPALEVVPPSAPSCVTAAVADRFDPQPLVSFDQDDSPSPSLVLDHTFSLPATHPSKELRK